MSQAQPYIELRSLENTQARTGGPCEGIFEDVVDTIF